MGWIHFLVRANDATLEHSFERIDKGADPRDARSLNTRFRLAASIAIALGFAAFFFLR